MAELAGVDVADAGAVGAGLAEAEVDSDLDSVFFAAVLPRLEPTTTGVSDSSEEYDSYSSTVFVTV